MFTSVLNMTTGSITLLTALLCTLTSIGLGLIIAKIYMLEGTYSKNFIMSLVLLPPLVQAVIMLVNGNLGTGVAVVGAFSLVRFRSLPGTSKEISGVFFSMAVGLATGMGYLTFAAGLTVIVSIVLVILSKTRFGEKNDYIELRISIPESLDYNEVFDDIFLKYIDKISLEQVKTTNLGSIFELKYNIVWKKDIKEKECIDELRCRNGNLPIVCGRPKSSHEGL